MYSLEQIVKILEDISLEFGDTFNIPVVINPRLVKTCGCCNFAIKYRKLQPVSLEISESHLKEDSEESILNTLKHEWIHYYLLKETNKNHGHNEVFRRYCVKLGIPPNRFTE